MVFADKAVNDQCAGVTLHLPLRHGLAGSGHTDCDGPLTAYTHQGCNVVDAQHYYCGLMAYTHQGCNVVAQHAYCGPAENTHHIKGPTLALVPAGPSCK